MEKEPTIIPDELLKTEMDFNSSAPTAIQGYKRRILTGMRPSGDLHLGHYAGALRNWLEMQERFDCTFLIADLHAFADNNDKPEYVRACVGQVALDWLSAGLDPEETHFTVQTGVPELENLTVLFETLVPLSVLQRNPTLKNELQNMRETQKTVSFHNYPVSEAADILGPLGDLVPAGDDQRPMIELTRNVARKVNDQFLADRQFKLPIPQIYTGSFGRIRGTDGNAKMGKSLGNVVNLNSSSRELKKRVNAIASPVKRLEEPGVVEGHLVLEYLDAFHRNPDEVAQFKEDYRKGGLGEGHLKASLYKELDDLLEPMREKRLQFARDPDFVRDVLRDGTNHTRQRVKMTLDQIRDAMGFNF